LVQDFVFHVIDFLQKRSNNQVIWYLSPQSKKVCSVVQAIEALLSQLPPDDSTQSASSASSTDQFSSKTIVEELTRKLFIKISEAGSCFVVIDGQLFRDTALLKQLIEDVAIHSSVVTKILLAYDSLNFPNVFKEIQNSSQFVGAIYKPKPVPARPRLSGRDRCWDSLRPQLWVKSK
jgi:hypothetical protein